MPEHDQDEYEGFETYEEMGSDFSELDAAREAQYTRQIAVRNAVKFCSTKGVNAYNAGDLIGIARDIEEYIKNG